MKLRIQPPLVALVLAAGLGLAACSGGGQAAAPTSPPTAAPTEAPAPTSTPRPTAEPTAEPAPEPTAEPAARLREVVIDELQTYTFASGLFSIDIPTNWDLTDNSTEAEAVLVWTDPSKNGAIIVDIFEDRSSYSNEDLTELLTRFLDQSFSGQPDFSASEPKLQSDGSILITWGYTATADEDVRAPLIGNSFIEKRGNKISIITTLIPKEQFDALVEPISEMLNSYTINPEAPVVAETTDMTPVTLDPDAEEAAAGELPETIIRVGETFKLGSIALTVNAVSEPPGDEVIQPDTGNRFVLLDLSLENIGSDTAVVSSLLQMRLFDSHGKQYDIDIPAMALAVSTADGEIEPGDTLSGGVGFQVPLDAAGLIFVYEDLFEGSVGVALE